MLTVTQMFQLSALLGQLNLDIKEVHAVSTNDGYFLDIFIVAGWDHKVFLSKSLHLANIWFQTIYAAVVFMFALHTGTSKFS